MGLLQDMEHKISFIIRGATAIIRLKKDYLVIADREADPFCIDLTLEKSPVYFALHGMGK